MLASSRVTIGLVCVSVLAIGVPAASAKTKASAHTKTPVKRVAKPAAATTPAAATAAESLFASTVKPASHDNDGSPIALGVRFSSSSAGSVSAIRYYQVTADEQINHVDLWSASGKRLANVEVPASATVGWHSVALGAPVALVAGTTYVASAHSASGTYPVTVHAFGTPVVAGHLMAAAGTYTYGGPGKFPSASYQGSNYFVDVVFTAASGTTTPPVTPPPVTPPPVTPPPVTLPPVTPPPVTPPVTPPPAGTPDASNTGVPIGTALTSSGSITIITPGAVVSGLDVHGTITVAAAGVTIRDTLVEAGQNDFGFNVTSGSVTVEDSTITGSTNFGIGFDNWTALRVNLSDAHTDGVKFGSHTRLQDSYIHDFTPAAGTHADGGQLQSGETDVTVVHNSIDPGSQSHEVNSALFIAPSLGPSSDGPVTIQNNLLGGGNYTVYIVNGNNGQYLMRHITFTGNQFRRDYGYGPNDVSDDEVPYITWSGNTWADTGTVLGE